MEKVDTYIMNINNGMSKSILAQIKYLTQSSNYLKSAS